jgi:hypothetical protein
LRRDTASILNAVRRAEIQLGTSSHLLAEFSEVVSRRHIARKNPKAAENADFIVSGNPPAPAGFENLL